MPATKKPVLHKPLTPALIEKWFVEHIHNSVVSRDTQVYNHVRKAVDVLKRRAISEE